MKVVTEIIHEAGHILIVLLFGGRILALNIRVEWPFAHSHTIWRLSDPTNVQIALVAVAGILFDTITTVSGQLILRKRKNMGILGALSVFWVSFWAYLSIVVYLVMGAFQPFGDMLDLLNAVMIPRLWIGFLGFTLLLLFTYSLSVILRKIFIRELKIERSLELVSIFWLLLHLFFVSLTIVKYGLPTPPIIAGATMVVIFSWSYVSGRWLMLAVSDIKGIEPITNLSEEPKPKMVNMGSKINDMKQRKGFIIFFSIAIFSALVTGVMVNQYISTYSVIMKTEVKVNATRFELAEETSILNTMVSVYNPIEDNLTVKRISFDVKLNGKYMTHQDIYSIPSIPPKNGISVEHTVQLPPERRFTIEEALEEDRWSWTLQGTGYIETMFGETLLRFKCVSNIDPE
ncbi:MAG: hypothetical protein ACLFVP_07360 [Candidatus Bathyarchaeia archaeon]